MNEPTGGKPVIDRQQHREMLKELAGRFPAVFSSDFKRIKPLKVGIHQDLEHALTGCPLGQPEVIQAFLDRYTRLYAYNATVAAGGARYGLDGTPNGTVTTTEAQIALGRARGAQRRLARTRDEASPAR